MLNSLITSQLFSHQILLNVLKGFALESIQMDPIYHS